MIDDTINPYSSPVSAENSPNETDLSIPVSFSGYWQSEDYLAALRNLDPAQVVQTILGILAIPLCVALLVFALRETFPISSVSGLSPFIWLMLTLMATPLCWSVWIVGGKRARLQRRRAKQKGQAESGTLKIGWADDKGVSVYSATSAYRATWDLFSQPLLFRGHTVLPISFNPSQRLVIPHRFFSKLWDCHSMRSFIHERYRMQKSNRPKLDDLKRVQFAESVAPPSPPNRMQPDATQRWDETLWPFEKQPSEIHEFKIVDDLGPAVKSVFAVVSGLAVFLAPLYGMLMIWLAWDRWQLGSWSFLSWRWGENLWMQFPVFVVTVAGLWMLWSQIRKAKHASRETIHVQVTDAGISFKRPSLETWNDWPEIVKSITEIDRAGWILKPLDDEVVFSKEAFVSEVEFNQFKSTLSKYTEPTNA